MNIELSSFALLILWVLLCYLIGTIQIGDIVSRKKNVEIRELGTKNPGASNIYDKLGPKSVSYTHLTLPTIYSV